MNRVLCLIILSLCFCRAYADSFVLAFHRSPPYSDITQDGQPFGMDLEISTAVSVQMGVELATINCPLARCLQFMKEGEADLILGLIKTQERQEYMAFVHPPYYTIAPTYAFYKKVERDIHVMDYAQLAEYSISVTRGAAYFPAFDHDPGLKKVESLSIDHQLNMLIKDRVDLVIGVESTLDFTIGNLGLQEQVMKVAYRAHSPVSAYMAVSRKSSLLTQLHKISTAVESLKESGQLAGILKRYNIKDIDLEKTAH